MADLATMAYFLIANPFGARGWEHFWMIPIDIALSQIWPLYWAVIHWIV